MQLTKESHLSFRNQSCYYKKGFYQNFMANSVVTMLAKILSSILIQMLLIHLGCIYLQINWSNMPSLALLCTSVNIDLCSIDNNLPGFPVRAFQYKCWMHKFKGSCSATETNNEMPRNVAHFQTGHQSATRNEFGLQIHLGQHMTDTQPTVG